MFKRILVPLDGSDNAEGVLSFVISEAQLHGSKVLLLRVIAPLRQSLMASPSALESAYNQIDLLANDYLETVSNRIMAEGIEVETLLRKGQPALQIIEIAKSSKCDLIVVGSHGETGAAQWRFGSVANKVVKARIATPMIIIPT